MTSAVAFVPARSGSERVPGKNVRPLAGHPLLAYAIETGAAERRLRARRRLDGLGGDRRDRALVRRGRSLPAPRRVRDLDVARRRVARATRSSASTRAYDLFAIVRATNPFRGPDAVQRGLEQLLATPEADSMRAVELVKQHPGKMWLLADDGRTMRPLLDQSQLDVAWHAGQYQALPRVYVQNSALEIAWTRVVSETGTREGRVVAPFLTEGHEGFNVDDEEDWERAEQLVATGAASLPRDRSRPVCSAAVKVATLETLFCDAGWRPWIFVKATTDDGLVGWAEITDSHGSPRGLAGIVEDLAPLVVGRDPRPVERIYWDLYRRTRQSPGSVIAKALAADRERAARPEGEGARRAGLRALRRADARHDPAVLVALRDDARAGVGGDRDAEARLLRRRDRARARGRRARLRARSRRTSSSRASEPQVLMPGFGEGGGTRTPARSRTRSCGSSRRSPRAPVAPRGRSSTSTSTSSRRAARRRAALEPFDLLWLEVDLFDPAALAHVRHGAPMPICSGENLYGARGFRPFLEAAALDVASVDVIWNGFHQAKKIADLAETFEVNCAPHNYYSHLATFIAAQWCAAIPNARILEYRRRRRSVARGARHGTAGDLRRRAARARPGPAGAPSVVEDVLREHPWPS